MIPPIPTARSISLLPVLLAIGLIAAPIISGCSQTKVVRHPRSAPPPPTFVGPAYLHGTIGSLATIRGWHPMLVNGWGFVTHLGGTGSSDVPAFLRQWMINEMRRRGVGSYRLGAEDMSPEKLLASHDTAVVRIDGLIPPGARTGDRFDVLVTALPGTQTTSLQGGQLWTTDLSVNGANPQLAFSRKKAEANGPLYINPFEDATLAAQRLELDRQAVVLSGGAVADNRALAIVLHQPSVQRARLIADAITERYEHEQATGFFNTAVAKTDQIIELNVPAAFRGEPDRLLKLILHLYLQRQEGFERMKAEELVGILRADPDSAPRVALAFEGLGKTALPVIRTLYADPDIVAQLAAIEAGVGLQDPKAVDAVITLASHADPAIRRKVAELLGRSPAHIRVTHVLKQLLDDPDRAVRLEAYESLAKSGDAILKRRPIGQRESFKFVLDLVPAEQPLVYITHERLPRIAIFGPDTGFKLTGPARIWDNHLMLNMSGDGELLDVFYQPSRGGPAATYRIAPTVANLALLMASAPQNEDQSDGMDLSFSRVANAIYQLSRAGQLDADLELRLSDLAAKIAESRSQTTEPMRPETEGPPSDNPAAIDSPANP